MEINGFETEELSAVKEEDGDSLWITVDSGASENVISERMAPQFEVKPSKGSRGGGKVGDRKRQLDEQQGREGRQGEDQGGTQVRHENAGD